MAAVALRGRQKTPRLHVCKASPLEEMAHRASSATVGTCVNRWPSGDKEPRLDSGTAGGYPGTGGSGVVIPDRLAGERKTWISSAACGLQR